MEATSIKYSSDGIGTAWRIWDLHVHTPMSIVQGYGGDTQEAWDKFLAELENLPKEMTVIGINDYWFLDGYKRVLKERESGRLQNLEAIFPVVEMRFNMFGGTDGKLSRVNSHVVFDPNLSPELIQSQFINALQSELKLSPNCQDIVWNGVITKESLKELGRSIKKTVPEDRIGDYDDDLQEGFNNLTVSFESVEKLLQRPYFKGKTLIGLGKTEWADIKWNNQAIATKKNIINSADFIFTAFEDSSRWASDVSKLRASNVRDRLLDCSDAHYFSDSDQHMRIGACQTWMNTTPTFAGLVYALEEFDRRVFVGLMPPSLLRIQKSPEQFISRVRVKSDVEEHKLFNYEIPMNPGFVAVVGNKGQGKSALLDCIALAGNSSRNHEFAFLNKTRFLSSNGVKTARKYSAEVEWASGGTRKIQLHEDYDNSAPVRIEYLPQAYVERVCNTDPSSGDFDEFEKELREILFTHIGDEDRQGEKTFDGLLSRKTRSSISEIDRLRSELRDAVDDYVTIASFRAKNQISEVNNRILLKQSEIDDAKEALKKEESLFAGLDDESSENGELVALRKQATEIETARTELDKQKTENEQKQARLNQSLSSLESIILNARLLQSEAEKLNSEANEIIQQKDSPIVKVIIDETRYEEWKTAKNSELGELKEHHETILNDLNTQNDMRKKNVEKLTASDSSRERARQRVIQSKERVAHLEGSEDNEDSYHGLCSLKEQIEEAPGRMIEARGLIIEISTRIHAALSQRLNAVKSLYSPASEFIEESEVVRNAGLEFDAALRILPTWHEFTKSLDARRNSDFPDWLSGLSQRVEDTSWVSLKPELEKVFARLEGERGELDAEYRDPAGALRSSVTLADFLMGVYDLSWLEVRFGLTGDGIPLAQLSPGQRGLVLTLFYLVVDRRTTPLLLDQPEENLDNETIASKLVPAIHEAAGRRQTIVVTHNANLAVVGDADQIVHCRYRNNEFTIESGSIAEIDVTRFAINVLEGTKPAFDNRRQKYEAFPNLSS